MSCYRTFFHRVPCGVSSIAIPFPSSSPRIASAAAKSRLARARAAMGENDAARRAIEQALRLAPGNRAFEALQKKLPP